jgi:hypothetical protein
MSQFYHIYISPKLGITRAQIQEKLNLAVNWFRYDDKNWIVCTTSDAKKWYSRLEQFVEPGGHIFIAKLNMSDYWGYMNKDLWEWIKKHKGDSG